MNIERAVRAEIRERIIGNHQHSSATMVQYLIDEAEACLIDQLVAMALRGTSYPAEEKP